MGLITADKIDYFFLGRNYLLHYQHASLKGDEEREECWLQQDGHFLFNIRHVCVIRLSPIIINMVNVTERNLSMVITFGF